MPWSAWTDERVEQWMGNLLRAGVLAAALVVLAGGVRYLVRYGHGRVENRPADGEAGNVTNFRVFRSEPPELRYPNEIVRAAAQGRSRALIQLGLLLLIATPVARVVFSLVAFLRQRDMVYVAITAAVLAVLTYSLFFGHG